MSSIVLLENFPYIGLFMLLILGGVGFPFPEDTTLILCGFLISHGIIKPVPALFLVYSGLIIADLVLYFFGKKYGRIIVTHKRFHKIISPEKLSMIEERFNKKGMLFILFGRHLIGLRAQLFLVAGVMRMPFLKFIVSDTIASFFTIAAMVGIGYIGGNSLQTIKKDIRVIGYAIIFIIVISLTIYLIYNYFKSRWNKTIKSDN